MRAPMSVTLARVTLDDAHDTVTHACIARGARVVTICDHGRVVQETSAIDDDDAAEDDDSRRSSDASTSALDAVRRAFDGERDEPHSPRVRRANASAMTMKTTHVGFHGQSPATSCSVARVVGADLTACARAHMDDDGADGSVLFVQQRDGAVAMWCARDASQGWRASVEAPYAGAPPLTLRAFNAHAKWRGDVTAHASCVDCNGAVYVVTLSEDASGGTWVVIRRVSVGADETSRAREDDVVVAARYADAEALECAGGEDFWVITRSGVMYRWNCRLARAVARVNVRAGRAAATSGSLNSCVAFPGRALTCVDCEGRRAFEVTPALGGPRERMDDVGEHDVRALCALERGCLATGKTSTPTSVARNGAFLWIAYKDDDDNGDVAQRRREICVYHTATGTPTGSVVVAPLVKLNATSTSASAFRGDSFELIDGGVSGIYACVRASGLASVTYRCVMNIPNAFTAVVAPMLASKTNDVSMIDVTLRDVESYGSSTERLSRALILARREAETTPEAFKTKRSGDDAPAITAMKASDARASCATAPALLLKARLVGRFDDVASARWNFAVDEALEALDKAANEFGAYSQLAREGAKDAKEILRTDWDAVRVGEHGNSPSAVETFGESDGVASLVHALEAMRVGAESLPSYAWTASRALVALEASAPAPAVREFIDAVWCGVPMASLKDDDGDVARREFVDALASCVDADHAADTTAELAPFEAITHLLYRIAPWCVLAFIDAVGVGSSSLSRSALATRALSTALSPIEHLERFNDAFATDALVRAIAHTLCVADAPRAGMHVALTFGGHYARVDIASDARGAARKTLACRGKTTLAGWALATELFALELTDRRARDIDGRRFASEAFASVSTAFRTLVEDWNDLPLRASPNDVDVDAAAEFVLRCADIARGAFGDAASSASLETKAAILDEARARSATMTDVLERNVDPELHVDSLERLVTACAHTLRALTSAS